ncbi:hypothetical protein D9M71_277930 [compost metagenome]
MSRINTIGSAANAHTMTQLAVVRKYMSLVRSCGMSGTPRATGSRPTHRTIRLDQTNAPRSSLRSYHSNVSIGITMLTANVIRNTPIMKAMKRNAGSGIEGARWDSAGSIACFTVMSSKKGVKSRSGILHAAFWLSLDGLLG